MPPVVRIRLFLPALLTALLLVAVLPFASGIAAAKPQDDPAAATRQDLGGDHSGQDNTRQPAGPKGKEVATKSDPVTEDTDTNDGNTPDGIVDDGDNAHPSGRDRSVEAGTSGNQGNATSDPDDDTNGPDRTNGGRDQASGPGGADMADQDGNNGCGNDDDFEDDNEGRCRPATPVVPDERDEDDEDDEDDEIVLDGPTRNDSTVTPLVPEFTRPMGGRNAEVVPTTVRAPTTAAAPAAVTAPVEVAGEAPVTPVTAVVKAPASRALAATGGSTMMLVVLTAMSMLLGSALLSARRLAVVRVRRNSGSGN